MPIRFRCVYCKQLMGISRRKAGSVVRCPKCTNQVMVPVSDTVPSPGGAEAQEPLFERSDFDELINQAAPPPAQVFDFETDAGGKVAAAAPAATAPPTADNLAPPATELAVEQAVAIEASKPATGILLSPAMATTLAICVIVGLAIAFVVGLFVGYSVRPRAEPAQSRAGQSTPSLVYFQPNAGRLIQVPA